MQDGTVHAVAAGGIRVHVSGDHEAIIQLEADVVAPVVIIEILPAVGIDIVGPEANLVVVASAISVLLSVENRRGGVAGQKVEDLSIDLNRDVPVAF